MLASPSDGSIDDFIQRYESTYGWYLNPETSKEVFGLIASISIGSDSIYFRTRNADFSLSIDANPTFKFLPVRRGWYTSSTNKLYYLERIPARQWKRGVCSANTAAYEFLTSAQFLYSTRLGLSLLEDLFTEREQEKNVQSLIKNKNPYVRLSSHFVISYDTIWFYKYAVGTINRDNMVVKLKNNIVLQELKDVSNRNDYGLVFK